ncbi:MAG: rRNA maturation RNase YbeY [Ferruginibacter sp.]
MSIHFFFIEKNITLRNRNKLKIFLSSLFKDEGKKLVSLNYIFCSDKYLLSINQEFLNHDFYTDTITFNLSEVNEPIEGEIYISVDRVRDNALKFYHSINEELHRVIFHGALHLCGYDDKTTSDIEIMRTAENKYLDLFFNGSST